MYFFKYIYVMKYLKISFGIFLVLALSRFIPHPPNFTNLLALSFYIPLIFGLNFIPIVILSFLLTDLYFGFHSSVFFTWGSVALIGYISIYFKNSLSKRLLGAASAAVIFFILSNFGVWISGGYGYTLNGLISCYILAIPFFGNTFVSTIIYSALIELIYKIYNTRFQREG